VSTLKPGTLCWLVKWPEPLGYNGHVVTVRELLGQCNCGSDLYGVDTDFLPPWVKLICHRRQLIPLNDPKPQIEKLERELDDRTIGEVLEDYYNGRRIIKVLP
jgi:hypothetical protein